MMHLVTAEAACNHLGMGVQNVGLELQYKTCYARVLDSKRKFLQAATQYYELSQIENVQSGPGQVGTQPCLYSINQSVQAVFVMHASTWVCSCLYRS